MQWGQQQSSEYQEKEGEGGGRRLWGDSGVDGQYNLPAHGDGEGPYVNK